MPMKRLTTVMVCVALSVGSCASRSDTPSGRRGRLSQVLVSINAFNDARVRAVLIDRQGRRTGWNIDRPIREIPGVLNGYGTEEGIPDESEPEDTTALAPADTVPGHPEPTPKYYYLSIQDSPDVPGLLDEAACELRLDPDIPGRVTLAITGSGVGLAQCQDTASVWTESGKTTCWRLEWSVTKGKSLVKLALVSASESGTHGH